MATDFDQQIIDEFRANRGRVGGSFDRTRLLLLTTTGAHTGTPHTIPLAYLPDGGRRVVLAAPVGEPPHPDWYYNVVANSVVTVETGVLTFEAKATVLDGEERARLFARAVEVDPGWAEQQASAAKPIPVIALDQVEGPPHIDALPGDALKLVHDSFRHELALIRAEVAESGASLGAQLRINCLTVCAGLHVHHESEDAFIFPSVAESNPELTDALARFREQHQAIKQLTDDLKELLAAPAADLAALRAEVDRLIDELEGHLVYEEENLIPVLNARVG